MATSKDTRPTYIFDLQTQRTYEDVGGKKNITQMGISLAALLNHATGDITVFTETDADVLLNTFLSSGLIVGLNLKKFSYRILAGYRNIDFQNLNSLDLLDYLRKKIVRRPCIEDLFSGTLNLKKSIDNMKFTRLYQEGHIEQARQLIIQNVQALNSVYSFGKTNGYVYLNDPTGQRWKISVSW